PDQQRTAGGLRRGGPLGAGPRELRAAPPRRRRLSPAGDGSATHAVPSRAAGTSAPPRTAGVRTAGVLVPCARRRDLRPAARDRGAHPLRPFFLRCGLVRGFSSPSSPLSQSIASREPAESSSEGRG